MMLPIIALLVALMYWWNLDIKMFEIPVKIWTLDIITQNSLESAFYNFAEQRKQCVAYIYMFFSRGWIWICVDSCAGLSFPPYGYFMQSLPVEDSPYLLPQFHMIVMYVSCCNGSLNLMTWKYLVVWLRYSGMVIYLKIIVLLTVGTLSCCCGYTIDHCVWIAALCISWEPEW